jgi:hypothetical protein
MTCNQRRAAWLAQSVCEGRVRAADVSDADWGLLLRAADLHNANSLPLLVCHRVLDRARRGVGYFAAPAGGRFARWAELRAVSDGRA